MEIVDLKSAQEFSPTHHVHKSLLGTPLSDISIACWEPGQIGPIHHHPGADEIYHVTEGEGLFRNGHAERRLGPGGTVLFHAGEVHQVQALTRLVLYRVQAGADRHPEFFDAWPEAGVKR
jgi:quercetin dioxygenase-like cupin family protein